MNASELVKSIDHAAGQSPSALKEEERLGLLAACEKLKGVLESPLEATVRFICGVLHTHCHRASNSMLGQPRLLTETYRVTKLRH